MIHLYSASEARPLAACLARLLTEQPADPMTPEWLAVPSDGMRRWLTLELARHLGATGQGTGDGVAANIVRAYPGTLRNAVVNADRGDGDPDPWSLERLVWSVLSVGHHNPTDPKLATFHALSTGASRFAKARRVADLFDRYHLHRPEMIRSWEGGHDVDGTGKSIADHAAWQPHLWRLVRSEIAQVSPPELLPGLLERLAHGQVELDLPPRLLLFGFTLLPGRGFLELVQVVAEHREVHLFLLESTHLEPITLLEESPRPAGAIRLRSVDTTANLIHHPLVRSWGRLHRETAVLLADAQADGLPVPEAVVGPNGTASRPTVLSRLQRNIRSNRTSSSAADLVPPDAVLPDRSVQFHACSGPVRQVEVLRDALLHLLAEHDGGLNEDDIVVVCPALDRFAPLIEGVFGRSESVSTGEPGTPSLRYRIADQSIRSVNPVLGATAELLELAHGRFEVSSVLDFLSLGPVRERFRFDDEDLATIAEWVRATNVRWGLDSESRVPFGVPASIVANSWQAALDRLLIGSVVFDVGSTLAVGGVAPYGVEGSDVEILGRLAEALHHIGDLANDASDARSVGEWIDRVRRACTALFATDRNDRWQIEALHDAFATILDAAGPDTAGPEDPGSFVPLEYVDLRRLVEEHLDAMVDRPAFFRGGITFTSMTPLRWVPYRVVALLGMDQVSFTPPPATADDLVAAAPQLGDPDPRAEARQSLLEAILAAGDHLLVLRDGQDLRTNQAIPRAVVTAELFDAVVEVIDPSARSEAQDALEVDHPRQAFDERCFTKGALVAGLTWGFKDADLEGARARRLRMHRPRPFLITPLPSTAGETIDLAELKEFFQNPTGTFLSRRLEARLPWSEEPHSELLPVQLRSLEQWRIGDRMLRARLAGVGLAEWSRAERARGTLPPGVLESQALADLDDEVTALVDIAHRRGVGSGPAVLRDVDIQLDGGTRLVGSVPLLLDEGTLGPARVQYARMKPHQYLSAWLDLMALVVSDPSPSWRSVAIGRSPDPAGKQPTVVDLRLSDRSKERHGRALSALAVASDCYRRGMREPIPLFPRFSYGLHRGETERGDWHGRSGRGDGDDQAVGAVFGSISMNEVLALPPQSDDPVGHGARAQRFADYLWSAVDGSCDDHGTAMRRPTPDGVEADQ